MLCIDKRLRLLSTDGAASMVLRTTGIGRDVVAIAVPGVVLGSRNRGFTISSSAAGESGLRVEAEGVDAVGNVYEGSVAGLLVSAERCQASNSLARANLNGFRILGTGHVLRDLTASGNVNGFSLELGPGGGRLTRSLAIANEADGFFVGAGTAGATSLEGNTAIANRVGVRTENSLVEIVRNNLMGHVSDCGVWAGATAAVEARETFWGSPAGAGPDPADDVCSDPGGEATAPSPVRRAYTRYAERGTSVISPTRVFRVACVVLVLGVAARGQAEKWAVAATGTDVADCGRASSPCRTLGFAIALANDGDFVSVGPGSYTEPGTASCGKSAERAMVCVDKRLTLRSTHGAWATVIHASGQDVVAVAAADVRFGSRRRGFTVRGDLGSVGLRVEADRVVVQGNAQGASAGSTISKAIWRRP